VQYRLDHEAQEGAELRRPGEHAAGDDALDGSPDVFGRGHMGIEHGRHAGNRCVLGFA